MMKTIKKIIFFVFVFYTNIFGIIYLNDDWTIPANTSQTFNSSTVIDGLGHDIIFEDNAFFKIDGPSGTTLTLRNCNVRGASNYSSGNRSIMFGTATYQKLILNDVVFNLSGDFDFIGGGLDIRNEVKVKGYNFFLYYNSEYDLTIKDASTLFIDFNIIFAYAPSDGGRNHLVMESNTSNLFLNGCTFAQEDSCGLELINGHLIVDHLVQFFNNGCDKKSLALCFGNNKESSNLIMSILPSANMDFVTGRLIYNNVDSMAY